MLPSIRLPRIGAGTASLPGRPIRSSRTMLWLGLINAVNVCLILLCLFTAPEASEFLLYLMLYIDILIVACWLYAPAGQRIDLLDPFYVFLGVYSLYSWSSATTEVFYAHEYTSVMRTYYWAVILGAVGFVVGYVWVQRKEVRLTEKLSNLGRTISVPRFSRMCWILGIALSLLTLDNLAQFFNISAIRPYTEWAAMSRLERTATSGLVEFVNQATITVLISALLLRSFVKKRVSILAFMALGAYTIPTIMAGHKGPLVAYGVLLILFIHYLVRPIRLPLAILLGLCLCVFVTVFNQVRTTTNLSAMAREAIYLVRTDPAVLLPLSGEFSGISTNLMDVADAIQRGRMSYSYGYTYVTEALTFIPRALYPSRPLPMSELYMQIFYSQEAAQGKGHGTFLVTEGYWAFGFFGVFLEMFVYGALVSLFFKVFLRNRQSGPMVIIYGILYFPLVLVCTRTGLLGSVKSTLMSFAPFALLLWYAYKPVAKKTPRPLLGFARAPQQRQAVVSRKG